MIHSFVRLCAISVSLGSYCKFVFSIALLQQGDRYLRGQISRHLSAPQGSATFQSRFGSFFLDNRSIRGLLWDEYRERFQRILDCLDSKYSLRALFINSRISYGVRCHNWHEARLLLTASGTV